jgi:ribosome-associated protein
MNELVEKALLVKKARMSTKPSKASIEKRMESKKKHAQNKLFRKKFKQED